jgi:hypothetical protein
MDPMVAVVNMHPSACRCSKIMSPPNCNETLSPSQDGDRVSLQLGGDIILEHLHAKGLTLTAIGYG